MSTATDKDTRLFRFGAVVPEEHQELALRLAELEDRLNAAFAGEEEPELPIYFIPTIVGELSDVLVEVEQGEDYLSVRLEVLPNYNVLVQSFLSALRESGILEEDWLADLDNCLQNGHA